jgi:hypothetical protein
VVSVLQFIIRGGRRALDAADRLRTRAYAAFPAPVELLAALRPLLIPIALLAAIASKSLPLGWAIALWVAIVVLIVPWIGRSPRRAWRVVKDAGRMIVRHAVGLGLFVGATVLLLYAKGDATVPGLERLDEAGGTPMALAIDATLIWIVAFALRMAGFIRPVASAFRWAVALLVLGTMLTALMYLRLLPSFDGSDSLPPVLLALTLLALGATWWHEHSGPRPPRVADHTRATWWWRRGVIWSLLSTVVLVAALVGSAREVKRPETSEVPLGQRADVSPRAPGTIKDDDVLARQYMPMLAFSRRQQWAPEAVGPYYAGASIGSTVPASPNTPRKGSALQADAAKVQPTDGPLPTRCPPGAPRPCWYLHCESSAAPCARTHKRLIDDVAARSKIAAYVRVVRRGEDPKRDAAIFKDGLPTHPGKVEILLQYWFFYAYDEWRAPVAGANIVQQHAGDWEAVTVALSHKRPLWVGYSQHCGGRSRAWERVQVANRRPFTHPLVAVAVGSHANYESPRSVRAPDFSSCPLFPGESIALLTYTWNLRDRTRDDWRALPKVEKLVDEKTAPMNFPGYWGKDDVLEFQRFGSRTLDEGEGPRSPPSQELWKDPMHKMFCGPAWRPQAPPAACAQARRNHATARARA